MRARNDVWLWLLLLLGAGSLGNGLWMLGDAWGWFARVASDVTPYNVHFVRDVGAAYATTGGALVWAAFRPQWRVPLVGVATAFHGIHALGHVRETASGELASFHWLADLPTLYLPALLMLAMLVVFARRGRSPDATATR